MGSSGRHRFAGDPFGLAALGGVRAASAGSALLQESSASFTVDTTQLSTLSGLAVAFAAPQQVGAGLDSLLLTTSATGMTPITEVFNSMRRTPVMDSR